MKWSFICRNMSAKTIKYLTQQEAIALDQELFNQHKFSVDQLMELAGLSCAHAFAKVFPRRDKKVFVAAGPGNNGGDGFVCARHLKMFGYDPLIYYPKRSKNAIMEILVHQMQSMQIEVIEDMPSVSALKDQYAAIIDAFFGFSFTPPAKAPFDDAIRTINDSELPVFSIDIPSGWHVEFGKPSDCSGMAVIKNPSCLISLTAPKLCAQNFKGRHFLGGRFVPPQVQKSYELNLPEYSGTDCILELS